MDKFTRLTAVAVPLLLPNVDTDTIIRMDRLSTRHDEGLGPFALEVLRRRPDGSEDPDCILNHARYRGAQILVAGENFGCGSSRENAVWALAQMGLRAVIAPSFGEIFFGNCFQNGMLPIVLPADETQAIAAALQAPAQSPELTIDLEQEIVITAAGRRVPFRVEALRRTMLLAGLDQIGLTLTHESAIAAFQARDRSVRPWLYGATRD